MILRYIVLAISVCFLQQSLLSQTLEDAKKLYLEGRYTDALPVFKAEYQGDPKNASLNQWLGVSLYKTGHIIEAEDYLRFASEKKITEAYLYLGELYVKLYRFDEAEKEFEKYQRANRRNEEALKKLEDVREYADRLKRYVSRTEDIQIIDSVIVDKTKFLSAYNVSQSTGSLMMLSDFFNEMQESDMPLFMNERQPSISFCNE
jgi:tetratricopeptide (TPR) repeat protein